MENTLGDFKKDYNILIVKLKKADAWLADKTVTVKRKTEWLDQGKMNILFEDLSRMMKEYTRLTGEEMNEKEILEGF